MSDNLLTQRRFLPYFCTQFLGAFNDNIYKSALIIMVTYRLVSENQGVLVNVAAILFILPFFLFGSLAGQLADKYEKAWLIQNIKLAEIGIMILGCIAIFLASVPLMLLILFLMGTQSAFFGPIKYSILPQHIERTRLLQANGFVEAATFIAILFGTVLGGLLAGDASNDLWLMLTILFVAALGYLVSFQIPSAKVAASNLKISYKFWSGTRDILKITYRDRMVFLSVLAISWFWFLGSIILSQFPAFAQNVLQGDDQVATLLLATFSVGIGIGSLLCSWLSSGRVEIGLMPIGAVGMAVFTWMLGETALPPADQLRTLAELAVTPGIVAVIINMIMIAISAGLFLVPLYAFMQIRTDEADRSRVIAANNIINAIFMITAGIMAAGMLLLGYDVLDIFKVTAVLTAIVTVYIMWMLPEFVLRFVAWLLIHSIYRVEKVDLHNVPEEGGALIVCNHVSFIDPMILHALLPRPARYVMYEPFYRMPVMNWLFRGMKSIPINTKKADEVVFTNAFNEIAECLEKGRLVVLFPEGGITRDGEIAKFQPGIDQILKRTPVPVVPIALRGVWGTWFSRHKGSAMKGLPTSWMRRISVISGESVPPEEANRLSMHEKVIALRGEQQ